MRLIDADALLNSGFPTIYHTEFGDQVINTDDIRNAPTVLPEDFMNPYEEGYERARKDFERPTGEWINPSKSPEIANKDFFSDCSNCGYTQMDETNYCPNCGAKMKGVEE